MMEMSFSVYKSLKIIVYFISFSALNLRKHIIQNVKNVQTHLRQQYLVFFVVVVECFF